MRQDRDTLRSSAEASEADLKIAPSPLIKTFREMFYNYFLGMWLCFELCNVCLLPMGIKYFPVAPPTSSLAIHLCWNSREFYSELIYLLEIKRFRNPIAFGLYILYILTLDVYLSVDYTYLKL